MQKCFYGSNMFVPMNIPDVCTHYTCLGNQITEMCLLRVHHQEVLSVRIIRFARKKLGGIKKDPKYSLLVIDTQLHFAQVEIFIVYSIFQAVD